MKFDITTIPGMKVTVMGLGLNGGGLESARFFARHGAEVTVTDLRNENILKPSIEALNEFSIRYVLETHEMTDFSSADLVIKNPAVKWKSPFIQAAKNIETDISVFLKLNSRPVIAVTGSKGKSTCVSALHYAMKAEFPHCDLGGNITVSPLSFVDNVSDDPVILELSSWQLADLPDPSVLNPRIALITNIMHDHMNHYSTLDDYARDKEIIFRNQSESNFTVCNYDDLYGKQFFRSTPGTGVYFSASPLPEHIEGGFLENDSGWLQNSKGFKLEILPPELSIQGQHNRLNMLSAALCGMLYGANIVELKKNLAEFSGIAHRMEYIGEYSGIKYYNDSAATIPQASIQAIKSFNKPVHIICGGTDKECDFTGFPEALKDNRVILLEGTATDLLKPQLDARNIPYDGPFDSLEKAFSMANTNLAPGDIVILSPGATSFGMFLNEFDRGNQFRELVKALP